MPVACTVGAAAAPVAQAVVSAAVLLHAAAGVVRARARAAAEEAAAAYVRDEHPSVWLLVSDYGGRLCPRRWDSWARVRGLRSVDEGAVYLRGHACDGGLEPRPSTVPAAGEGLFATRRFAAGELVCVYRGKRVSLADVNQLSLADGERDYVMGGFGLLWHVDAREAAGVKARYINDTFTGEHNVRFEKVKGDLAAKAVALRDLRPGEELFARYGEPYWKPRGMPDPYGASAPAAPPGMR